MKLRHIFAAAAAMLVAQGAEAVDLTYEWGQADTVACHTIGPGMTYAKVVFPDKPLILWWVDIDLQNPYCKVEQVQSRHAVPDTKRWDVMTHYRENSREGHRVKVAWNHDFFSYEMGICIGINISEGEMTWNKWGRSLLAITDGGMAEIFYPAMDSHITAADGATVEIDYFNAFEGGSYGDCIFYNRFNSKTLDEAGRYVAVEPLDPWIVNGADPIRCRVTAVSDEPLQTADGTCVVFTRGSKIDALNPHVEVGDIIEVTQRFNQAGFGVPPERILNAFHGYPSIVRNGVLHEGEFNDFENGREYEKSSRVMAGISQDKTHLYIATTEMSSTSLGVDCIELCAWMVEHGAWDIVNFDSGGSAAIVIDEQMLNLPGRGSVRPVEDAVLAVSLAPDDDQVDHLTFSAPFISPSVISRTPLRVMSFNQYGEVISDFVEGCTFSVEPPELGYVDENSVFHSSIVRGHGVIIARRDGMEARMEVNSVDLADIAPTYNNILIDSKRQYLIGITGASGMGRVAVDPGAFTWTAVPDGVVEVSADGVLTGLSEGTAVLTGRFDDLSFDINVTVEIAGAAERVFESFADLSAVSFTASSQLKNRTISYTDLPEGWTSGASVDFDLTTGRAATMKMTFNRSFYSLPDSLGWRIYDRTGAVQSIDMSLVDALGERFTVSAPVNQGDAVVTFPFVTLERDETEPRIFEVPRYPITLRSLTCNMANAALPGSRVAFGPMVSYHPGYEAGVEMPVAAGGSMTAMMQGETLVLRGVDEAATMVEIYTAAGVRTVSRRVAVEADGTAAVDAKELVPGLYFVVAAGANGRQAVRLIVR